MSNNTELKKDEIKASNPKENPIGKKKEENLTPKKVTGKNKKKHSSALAAASLGRSAVDHAKAHSRSDVSGSSGLANEGPYVSYEKED